MLHRSSHTYAGGIADWIKLDPAHQRCLLQVRRLIVDIEMMGLGDEELINTYNKSQPADAMGVWRKFIDRVKFGHRLTSFITFHRKGDNTVQLAIQLQLYHEHGDLLLTLCSRFDPITAKSTGGFIT